MTVRILVGDCRDVLRTLPECSVEAIVCDPPYELGFMGKTWDRSGVAFDQRTWAEALRVAKPGAYLLTFGGTRTFHRMACAIEDAGWEIRDTLGWLYGTGFPKSHNGEWGGTALKPAYEPIIMARKPLIGTVAANHAAHGTGGLNIDACRIAGEKPATTRGAGGQHGRLGAIAAQGRIEDDGLGRWPANILHDGSDEALSVFPDSDGQQADLCGHSRDRVSLGIFGDMKAARNALSRGDSGSAARFFWSPKAGRKERDAGLNESMPERPLNWSSGTKNPGSFQAEGTKRSAKNNHPTVKPVALMQYLCRLVTPPGGTVLDPFMGSGSTGIAASREGFGFIGIEQSQDYADIAERRIRGDAPLLNQKLVDNHRLLP